MEQGNDWWLAATTPDGVHLYQFGHDDADAADERSLIIDRIRADLGGEDGWPDAPSEQWRLEFAPGRPDRFFTAIQHDDGTWGEVPQPGVTVHDKPEA